MKNEYDLDKLKKRSGKTQVDPSAAKSAISLRLCGGLIADLKTEALRLGIPYQTLIGSILHRYVNHELVDVKSVEMLKRLKSKK